MEYTVIDSIWYGTIGIVAIDSDGHGWKCYIGQADGYSPKHDEQQIAREGMPTGKPIACAAFPRLDPRKFLY